MEVVTTVAELREKRNALARLRWAALSRRPIVGLVPTMGALHGGHASLLDHMANECDVRMASIFVNPRQFSEGEDLSRYPRSREADLELCNQAGVDLVFAPDAEEMYPGHFEVTVQAGALATLWEGEYRLGHFDGVLTVVAKLFNICRPDRAYFGEKDFQQLRIVEQMVLDLDFEVLVVPCPIIRDQSGLALSSRNSYLSEREREYAPHLYRALHAGAEAFAAGERSAQHIIARAGHELEGWTQNGLLVDYMQVVDPSTLAVRDEAREGDRLIAAVRLGSTRLIDNVELSDHTHTKTGI
jgi:pantoate--beta-alanine ligase